MKSKFRFLMISIILTFLVMNYFPDNSLAEEIISIQESEGVVVISNPKTPELRLRIVFTEELSIGEIEGDENYMFGSAIYFNTDDEGNFYVVDYDNHRILKYNPEGKFLFTIGREGQGPGEFRSLSIPLFDKDDNLYIDDGLNRRISFFDKNGQYLRQVKYQERYSNVYFNSKGYMVAAQWNIYTDADITKFTYVYGLFDDKFNIVAEFYKDEQELPSPTGRDESALVKSYAEVLSMSAFAPQLRYILANNDFVYLGYPEKYEIKVYSSEGKLVKKITRDYDPIPVSEKDKERYAETSYERMTSPIFTEDMKKKVLQQIKYPKYKPAYLSFTLMENGWLAVLVDFIEDEYMLIDLFDQDGKFIAHFKTPVLAEGLYAAYFFFRNGKAYTVATEEDYRFVKRYSFEIQEFKDGKWVSKK